VRLWRAGANPWDGGVINLTPEAAQRVMAEYTRRGNPLSMDIEHAITLAERKAAAQGKEHVEDPPIQSAGYCALELVETPDGPEIWFLPRWSDCGRDAPVPGEVCCAKHQIESGQRDQVSPDWDADASTGEPIRINRISLVLDGATHGIGLLAARAAMRRTASMAMDEDPIARCKAAYAYHTAMASQGGEDKQTHEDMAAKIAGHAAALGINLDEKREGEENAAAEPAEPPAEPAPEVAAEPTEPPSERREEPRMSAAQPIASRPAPRAAAKPPVRAAASRQVAPVVDAKAIEQSILEQIAARDERKALLDANADRLSEPQRRLLAGKPLKDVRDWISTLPARPQPPGPDAGAPAPGGRVRPWKVALSESHQLLASRVIDRLGATQEQLDEFDKIVDDSGSVTVSIVDIVRRQQAARMARRVA